MNAGRKTAGYLVEVLVISACRWLATPKLIRFTRFVANFSLEPALFKTVDQEQKLMIMRDPQIP
jgi:hypothetical protein